MALSFVLQWLFKKGNCFHRNLYLEGTIGSHSQKHIKCLVDLEPHVTVAAVPVESLLFADDVPQLSSFELPNVLLRAFRLTPSASTLPSQPLERILSNSHCFPSLLSIFRLSWWIALHRAELDNFWPVVNTNRYSSWIRCLPLQPSSMFFVNKQEKYFSSPVNDTKAFKIAEKSGITAQLMEIHETCLRFIQSYHNLLTKEKAMLSEKDLSSIFVSPSLRLLYWAWRIVHSTLLLVPSQTRNKKIASMQESQSVPIESVTKRRRNSSLPNVEFLQKTEWETTNDAGREGSKFANRCTT